MSAELDHVFVMCSVDAPEAAALARVGLKEGSANTHKGQGTASRRFFFSNAYLELVWVDDPVAAQSEAVRAARLWDRWIARSKGSCPFGIVLRPDSNAATPLPPFPTWAYRPGYLPAGGSIQIALDTPLTEPGFFYLDFQRGRARGDDEPVTHAISVRSITDLTVGMPTAGPRSTAARATEAMGIVSFEPSDDYMLRLTFDGATSGEVADLRPDLPLALRWPRAG